MNMIDRSEVKVSYRPSLPGRLSQRDPYEPILNPVLVALTVGEPLSPLALAGGAVVFVTVMVYDLSSVRKGKEEAAPPEKTETG